MDGWNGEMAWAGLGARFSHRRKDTSTIDLLGYFPLAKSVMLLNGIEWRLIGG